MKLYILWFFDFYICSQTSQDLLDNHRKRNNASHPPSTKQLLAAAQQQLNVDGTEDEAEEKTEDNSEIEEPCQRTQRHCKGTLRAAFPQTSNSLPQVFLTE